MRSIYSGCLFYVGLNENKIAETLVSPWENFWLILKSTQVTISEQIWQTPSEEAL